MQRTSPAVESLLPPAAEGRLRVRRGAELATATWLPVGPPRALAIILHGLNGHSRNAANCGLVAKLLSWGYAVFSLDWEHHGRSSGSCGALAARGLVRSVSHLASDAVEALAHTSQAFPTLRPFLVASSLGGAAAVLACLRMQAEAPSLLPDGLVLLCPLIQIRVLPPRPLRILCRLLAHFGGARLPLLPLRIGAGLGGGASLRLRALRARLRDDPLNYSGRLRIGTAVAVEAAARTVQAQLGGLSVPFLICQGDEDVLVAASGARALYCRAVSDDKALRMYRGAGHALLDESSRVRRAVLSDVRRWMGARAPPSGDRSATPSIE